MTKLMTSLASNDFIVQGRLNEIIARMTKMSSWTMKVPLSTNRGNKGLLLLLCKKVRVKEIFELDPIRRDNESKPVDEFTIGDLVATHLAFLLSCSYQQTIKLANLLNKTCIPKLRWLGTHSRNNNKKFIFNYIIASSIGLGLGLLIGWAAVIRTYVADSITREIGR
jgi:hypothetical protein